MSPFQSISPAACEICKCSSTSTCQVRGKQQSRHGYDGPHADAAGGALPSEAASPYNTVDLIVFLLLRRKQKGGAEAQCKAVN